ncbi:hypothetical protein [uncultured Nostoc sp.]|uniref:hypothetical protein n=1 Tax=uncultured Nostoc sp. TaxID=340711 RepID=UPI0035CBF9EB
MTLVRLWRLPLGEDSLTLLYETLNERYRRRALNLWTTAKSCLNTVMARLSDLLHKNHIAAIAG